MKSDWKLVTLSAISTQLSDGLHKAPIFVPGGEYIFVNATNLENGTIVDKDQQKHTTYEEFLKYGVALDDRTILYSIDGTIGNIAVAVICFKIALRVSLLKMMSISLQ